MSDFFWYPHREPKAVWYKVRPPGERRCPVAAVKGRIDLNAIEHRGVSGKAASFLGKPAGDLFGMDQAAVAIIDNRFLPLRASPCETKRSAAELLTEQRAEP